MFNRGQSQVLWIILEVILVISASISLFTFIHRAGEDALPEQQFLAKELALTRESLDLFAGSNIVYYFRVPGMDLNYPLSVSRGEVSVGLQKETYLFDASLGEIPFEHAAQQRQSLYLELGGRVIRTFDTAGWDASRIWLRPCIASVPAKVALIPTSPETTLFANFIAPQDAHFSVVAFDDKAALANVDAAVLLVAVPSATDLFVAKATADAQPLACMLVNGAAPLAQLNDATPIATAVTLTTTENIGIVPIGADFDLPAAYAAFRVANKPFVVFEFSIPSQLELQTPYLKAKADQIITRFHAI
jgi:hypothetical protein